MRGRSSRKTAPPRYPRFTRVSGGAINSGLKKRVLNWTPAAMCLSPTWPSSPGWVVVLPAGASVMAPPEIDDCHLDSDCYALGLAPVTRMQGLSLLRGAPKTDQLLLDARKAEKKRAD